MGNEADIIAIVFPIIIVGIVCLIIGGVIGGGAVLLFMWIF